MFVVSVPRSSAMVLLWSRFPFGLSFTPPTIGERKALFSPAWRYCRTIDPSGYGAHRGGLHLMRSGLELTKRRA